MKHKKRWALQALLAVAAWAVGAEKADARIAPPMQPVEYLAARSTWPTQSPFRPQLGYDPAPMLDFQPWSQSLPKPQLKTKQEISDGGYWLWQEWANERRGHDLYDPFTGAWWGYEEHFYRYDAVGNVYRRESWGWNWESGNWSLDTGWVTGNSFSWEREMAGSGVGYGDNYPHASGFDADISVSWNGSWKLANLRNTSMPNFEIGVRYELWKYGYGVYRGDAAEQGTLKRYSTWRAFVVAPGQTENITPDWVPQNYEFWWDGQQRVRPYLILDWKSYADNNSELPEWVEGHVN